MPLNGNLRTMSLCDLLSWAGQTQKTGVLELERNKICRRVEFRKGWIGACSSSDPASRLGQFLLGRGKITEQLLRDALARQSELRKNLGWILLDMNVLSRKELTRLIAVKAEETMHGLFEWQDAVFRFNDGATLDPDHIEVSLSVEDMITRGNERLTSMRQIREVFGSSGIVLNAKDGVRNHKSLNSPMARRILECVDGERTLGEVLIHARASEFVVLRFLFQLQQKGLLDIVEERTPSHERPTILDVEGSGTTAFSLGDLESPDTDGACVDDVGSALDRDLDVDVETECPIPEFQEAKAAAEGSGLAELEVAAGLMMRGEHEAALELLNATYRSRPEDAHLRTLLARAEEAYVEAARRRGLSFDKIPTLMPEAAARRDAVRPEDAFLLSTIDGRMDIQSILWVTPLREVDVLMALRRLLDRDLIHVGAPDQEPCPA